MENLSDIIKRAAQSSGKASVDAWTEVINRAGTDVGLKVMAVYRRALRKREIGDSLGAVQDFTTVIGVQPRSPDWIEWVALSYLRRGKTYRDMGNLREAVADFRTLLEMPEHPSYIAWKGEAEEALQAIS